MCQSLCLAFPARWWLVLEWEPDPSRANQNPVMKASEKDLYPFLRLLGFLKLYDFHLDEGSLKIRQTSKYVKRLSWDKQWYLEKPTPIRKLRMHPQLQTVSLQMWFVKTKSHWTGAPIQWRDPEWRTLREDVLRGQKLRIECWWPPESWSTQGRSYSDPSGRGRLYWCLYFKLLQLWEGEYLCLLFY